MEETDRYDLGKMSSVEFQRRFPEIATDLNWDRFAAESWPVAQRVVSEPETLGRFFTFFRLSLGRINPHFLHRLFMRQMRVNEVVSALDRLPDRDARLIRDFAEGFRNQADVVEMDVPAYGLPDGGCYLLDANHRCCALALSGVRFRLTVHVVQGPVDKDAQSDITQCRFDLP